MLDVKSETVSGLNELMQKSNFPKREMEYNPDVNLKSDIDAKVARDPVVS
jgi:hypothetical protein